MLLKNFNRKTIAVISAIIIWIFVNQSITETKTIPNVPIKVTNLPSDKTIVGLLPNGYISQRVALSLSGSKDVIQKLEPGDLEVHLDASTADNDNWIVQITKKNIVSLNPSLDLRHHLTSVNHPELIIKLSNLVTEKIPIYVKKPIGTPPEGYEYLDVWPDHLTQTLSGPKEEIEALKSKGLDLILNLNNISKESLDTIKHSNKWGRDDEISFPVPEKWKKIPIPFRNHVKQEINDPEAQNLRIDFLKKELLPIGKEIPINVFYPLKYNEKINPLTEKLAESKNIHFSNGLAVFTLPLYVRDVSKQFLDIIRDQIELVIIASPNTEREHLQWSIEVVDTNELENIYVALVISEQNEVGIQASDLIEHEEVLRKRFRDYMQKLSLYTANGEKLNILATASNGKITIKSE